MLKKLLALVVFLMVLVNMGVNVSATTIVDTNTQNADSVISEIEDSDDIENDIPETEADEEEIVVEEDQEEETTLDRILGMEDIAAEKIDTEDIEKYIDKKGGEIVGLVQKVFAYIAAIFFLVSLVYTIIGVFGTGNKVAKGVVMMLVSAIAFIGIYFGPQILIWFKDYMSSV